jgi:hypothetical protein
MRRWNGGRTQDGRVRYRVAVMIATLGLMLGALIIPSTATAQALPNNTGTCTMTANLATGVSKYPAWHNPSMSFAPLWGETTISKWETNTCTYEQGWLVVWQAGWKTYWAINWNGTPQCGCFY